MRLPKKLLHRRPNLHDSASIASAEAKPHALPDDANACRRTGVALHLADAMEHARTARFGWATMSHSHSEASVCSLLILLFLFVCRIHELKTMSAVSSSSPSARSSLYSPFHHLLMEVMFQCQVDCNHEIDFNSKSSDGQKRDISTFSSVMLKFAAFSHASVAETLELISLTQVQLHRSTLLPLVLDSFLIPDCVGIVLEYVDAEDPKEGRVYRRWMWVCFERPDLPCEVDWTEAAEMGIVSTNRLNQRCHIITLLKLECILGRMTERRTGSE